MHGRAYLKNYIIFLITFCSFGLKCSKTSSNNVIPGSTNLVSALDFVVPVRLVRGLTGNLLLTENPFQRRLKFRDSIKELWEKDLLPKKNQEFKSIEEFRNDINSKVSSQKDTEKFVDLKSDLLGLLEDKRNQWATLEIDLQHLLEYFDKHKEMTDKEVFDKFNQNYTVGRFSLDDLTHVEKMLAEVTRDIDLISKKKEVLTLQKAEIDDALVKLEQSQKKKDLKMAQATSVHFRQKEADDEAVLIFLDRNIYQQKLELYKLRSYSSTIILSIVDEDLEMLRAKQKDFLEPILQKIKKQMVVNLNDLRRIELKIDHLKQRTKSLQDELSKTILTEKQKQDALSSKIKDLQVLLKSKKASLSDNSSDSIDVRCDIFFVETSILKFKTEIDLVDQTKIAHELSKKKHSFAFFSEFFYLLRAKAFYHFSNNNEKELMKLLDEIRDSELPNVNKQYDGVAAIFNNIENFLITVSSRKLELKERREILISLKNSLFLGKRSLFQDNLDRLNEAEELLDLVIKKSNESRLDLLDLKRERDSLIESLESLKREVSSMIGLKNLASRSPGAISWNDVVSAWLDFEHFVKIMFWATKEKLNPVNIFNNLTAAPLSHGLGFLLLFFFYLIFALIAHYFLYLGLKNAEQKIASYVGLEIPKRYILINVFLELGLEKFFLVFGWIYFHIFIKYAYPVIGFSFSAIDHFYLSLFYLLSIFLFCNVVTRFINLLIEVNDKLKYFLFREHYFEKNFLLINVALYTTAVLIPLLCAISIYSPYFKSSILSSVLLAAYSLLLAALTFLFFDKDDVLALVPHYGYSTWLIRKGLEKFYYPILVFFIGIYVFFNPYVGYTNLGWWLLFHVPASVFVLLVFYFIQVYGKLLAQKFFLSEGDLDGEVIEKFDNARIFYGLYVVGSFVFCTIGAYAFLAKLWTEEFRIYFLWHQFADVWTISLGDQRKFGVIQFFIFCCVVMGGYFFHLFVQKSFLNKLFDIFRCESGLKNTITRIFFYITIVISIIIGLVAIDLGNIVQVFTLTLLVGVGIGMRDQIADVFAGILILLERQIEEDHFIEFGDIRGSVHKISFRSTTVRTVRNFFISIPNRLLITKMVTNWGAGRVAVGMEFSIRVAFGADPELVCGIIRQIIYENNQVLKVPAAIVRLDEFSEYGMVFFARAFLSARKVRDQWDIAAAMRVEIMKALKTHGIELSYPHLILQALTKSGAPVSNFSLKLDEDVNNSDDNNSNS